MKTQRAMRDPAALGRGRNFPCFEGLRTVGVISVIVSHVGFVTTATQRASYGEYIAHLEYGPALFFVVSAFLLYRSYVSAAFAGRPVTRFRHFMRRRIWRIVPAYWVALTCFILFFGVEISGLRDVLTYYFFLQIYDTSRFLGGIPQAWTLCIEVSFYFFLPVYAWVLRRLSADRSPDSRLRVELLGALVLIVICIVWRTAWFELDGRNPMARVAVQWLPGFFDVFGIGIALAAVSAWVDERASVPRFLEWVGEVPWLWVLLAIGCYLITATQLGLPRSNVPSNTPIGLQAFFQQSCNAMFALFIALPAVFGPDGKGAFRRFLTWAPVAYLGLMSYGVYLWHGVWLEKALEWTGRPGLTQVVTTGAPLRASTFPLILALTLVLSFASGIVSYYVVERPTLKWKDRRVRDILRGRPAARIAR
jgi:peptidoglycan/LPS O-acetylase OafA/YrhL